MNHSEIMNIYLNDKEMTLPEGATLAQALQAASIPEKGIAAALNGSVVPASERAATKLNDGDRILVIKAFYGG